MTTGKSKIPASIRTNNPGAMWGGKHARKWGAVDDVVLNDGQANHIAVFPDVVSGAAAQFDLWRAAYCDMTLAAAIRKWSGHNASTVYANFLNWHTGLSLSHVITPPLLASETGLSLMKAQAQWEAGRVYPMTDEQWREAQARVFPKS